MFRIRAAWFLASVLPLAGETATPEAAFRLCPELPAIVGANNWYDALTNPVLTSEAEIEARLRQHHRLLGCLTDLGTKLPLSPELKALQRLSEYFVIFASPPRDLVDFSTSHDAAVRKLRDQVRLPAPRGFIYIRYFNDKSQLPEAIQPAFDNPETQAVTLWGRYIAVLLPSDATSAQRQLATRTMPKVLSHELVHAYINGSLRLREAEKLPRWFQEGSAIYFSGSGGTESAVELSGSSWTIYTVKDTREYREYGMLFRELERRMGRQKLYSAIRESVERRDPGVLLRATGASTAEELIFDAKEREARTQRVATYIVSFALVAFCYLIYRSFRPPAPALPAAPLALVQTFHRLTNQINSYVPEPKSEELLTALALLDRHGAEQAYYIVHYASRQLRHHAEEFGQSRLFMLPDALPYEAEAVEHRNKEKGSPEAPPSVTG